MNRRKFLSFFGKGSAAAVVAGATGVAAVSMADPAVVEKIVEVPSPDSLCGTFKDYARNGVDCFVGYDAPMNQYRVTAASASFGTEKAMTKMVMAGKSFSDTEKNVRRTMQMLSARL